MSAGILLGAVKGAWEAHMLTDGLIHFAAGSAAGMGLGLVICAIARFISRRRRFRRYFTYANRSRSR